MRVWKRRMSNVPTRPMARATARRNGRAPGGGGPNPPRGGGGGGGGGGGKKNRPPAWRTDRRTSIDSPHEVSEDGLEAVVRALQPSDVEPAVEDDPREVPTEGLGPPRADEGR